jgi:uncharacterized membrane protein YjjB (DUF3815 family)
MTASSRRSSWSSDARVIVLPTALMISFGPTGSATIESIPQLAGALRLDQISALYELVGLPSEAVVHDTSVAVLGAWAPWLGVFVFGIATAFYFSAPEGALPWLLLVLVAAWLGQLVGDRLFGGDVSGFFGALAMTPVALAVARLRHGPPSQVTFLPAFWLLVSGAIGLVGVTEVVGDPATRSTACWRLCAARRRRRGCGFPGPAPSRSPAARRSPRCGRAYCAGRR